MKKIGMFMIFSFGLLLLVCNTEKSRQDGDSIIYNKVQPIDIKAPKFFWLLQPWKEGKLATIDGWGRFAEISFQGINKMKINTLDNFPRTQMDRDLITWPEAGLITSTTSDQMHHIAAIDDKKTKSHVPKLTWECNVVTPVLLDSREGLIAYQYSLPDNKIIYRSLFVYNYKEDRIVYIKENYDIVIRMVMNNKYALSDQCYIDGKKQKNYNWLFYDWRTGEILENDLTNAINQSCIDIIIRPCMNIHINRRFLFGYSNILEEMLKLSWNDEYSDIKISPLSYLAPVGKIFDDFVISIDGIWGTTLVGGYRGINNEYLYKRAFFHLDDRYPNGISIPFITEDYEEYQWDFGAFVNHPVHGMCFAQEWHKEGKLYLRLYKMDEVLADINRQLEGKK